jgi:hypothetical protein
MGQDVGDDRVLAERICRACVDGLDIDGAAISLHTASTLRQTLYAGDATSDLLEELQFTLGEGACMDAARTGRPVLVPDMADVTGSARWPVYAAAVVEQAGVGAVFALPRSGPRSTSGYWTCTARPRARCLRPSCAMRWAPRTSPR